MFKRIFVLTLALALCISAVVPVSAQAAEDEGAWIELLETATVNDSGNNLLQSNAVSTSFRIKTPQYMRCTKVDLVLTHPSGYAPSALYVSYSGTLYKLTKVVIDATTTRFYGANIPDNLYADLVFQLERNSTTSVYFQVVTCKVSSMVTESVKASGTLKRSYSDSNPLTLPNSFSVAGDGSTGSYQYLLIPVAISDWRKFDSVTLFGSASTMAISSFRASIGNKGLPYEITYMQAIPTGFDSDGGMSYDYVSWSETNYYTAPENPDEGTHEEGTAAGDTWNTSTIVYGGSVLFTVTIDLTGIDRSVSGDLGCFFTAIASPGLGYAFNVQDASGTVSVADTTPVSWWNRFTSFMQELFGGDTTKADQFATEMEQNGQAITDANEQLESVSKPSIEEVPIDPSQYLDSDGMTHTGAIFQRLLGNELVLPMASITLICGLAAFIIF